MCGCNKKMNVFVPRGFGWREITVTCGSTSPSGEPWLCIDCEKANAGRDWRREAEEAGETWDEDEGVG
jgi:hypothetical protein